MLVIFDLEVTAWEGSMARGWSGPGEYPEIIQLGAVRLDSPLVEVAAFDALVKPRLNPALSDYIVALTGIRQERLDREGIAFAAAQDAFARFADGAEATLCNGRDHEWLRHNYMLHGVADVLQRFRFASLSRHFMLAAGRKSHITNSTLPDVFGLEPTRRAHDGLADARAITAALRVTLPTGGVPELLASLAR